MASKITKSFLEEAIKEPVEDFTVGPGSNPGDNVAGQLLAIKATGKSGNVHNLVYKFMAEDPMNNTWAKEAGIFRTEMAVYCHFIPLLEKLVEKHSGTPFDSLVPKFYCGLTGADDDYLLLEDLRPSGYIMQDKYSGLNFEEVSLIFQKIAEFHASTYFYLKREGERHIEEHEYMKHFGNNPFTKDTPENRVMANIMFGECQKLSVKLIKKHNEELGEKIEKAIPSGEAAALVRQNGLDTDTKHFPCIIHGDFWVNNIMIKYENDDRRKPIGVKFIDFQMTRRENIFQDLNYFLTCSTTPEFRKRNYDRVLRVYYDAFTSFLVDRLKTEVPIGFSRGYFLNSMYDLIVPGYVFMGFAIPLQLAGAIDFTLMGQAAEILGVDLSTMPIPNGESGDKQEEKGLPSGAELETMIKLRMVLMYIQMEKSARATERLLQMAQELVDLKLV